MLGNYTKVTIPYSELKGFNISTQPFILTVEWDGVKFDFLIRIKERSSHLLIFGSGANTINNENHIIPSFQRYSWIDDLEDSVIFYNDPTLYLGKDITLGWGQGTVDRFYLKDIADILTILIEKIQIPSKNVLFYGASCGGFMSMFLAGFIKETTALVNSPQTCLSKWLPGSVEKVFKYAYPSMSITEVLNKYPDRINLIHFYKHIKYVPKIYYLQNAYCKLDMVDHVIPFIEGLQNMGEDIEVNNVKFDFYYHVQPGPAMLPAIGGHGALEKLDTINYINKVKTEF